MNRALPVSFVAALAAMCVAPTAAALTASQAKTCKAMGAELQTRQKSVAALKAEREALAAEVETLGLAWDDAQVMRNASKGHAAAADAAQAAYEAAKAELIAKDGVFVDAANGLNAGVAQYNASCVKP